ncbi:MAG: hypothetical protein AAB390_00755, partial [Patescibacteria group bacterium]
SGGYVADYTSGKAIKCNERYATTWRGGLDVTVHDTQSAAASELAWARMGEAVVGLVGGEPSGRSLNSEALRGNEIRPEDAAVISRAVHQKFSEPAETGSKSKEKKQSYQTELSEYLARLPAAVRAYQDHHYEEGALTKHGLLKTQAEENAKLNLLDDNQWYSLYPLLDSLEKDIFSKFGQAMMADFDIKKVEKNDELFIHDEDSPGNRETYVKHLIKLMIKKIAGDSFSVSDALKHARLVAVDSPAQERKDQPSKVVSAGFARAEEGELVVLYEPRNSRHKFDEYKSVDKDGVIEYLTVLSKDRPEAGTLIETLRKWPKSKVFPPQLATVCLGHFVQFRSEYGYNYQAGTNEVIAIWRQAAAVYREDWKNVEQFKSLDEQLSVWEWRADTAGLFKVNVREKTTKKAADEWIELINSRDGSALAAYIEKEFGDDLSGVYKSGSKETDVKFSWPLFMEDVWQGKEIFPDSGQRAAGSGDGRNVYNPEKKFQLVIANFCTELRRIVDDPKNLDSIKKMQPGFFREFLLEKKMEKLYLRTLDEIEPWLEYFTARAHEGSERNQVPGLIETARRQHREKRKEELAKAALLEFLDDPSDADYFTINTKLNTGSLTDIDISISITDSITDWRINSDIAKIEAEIKSINDGTGDVGKLPDLEKKRDSLKKMKERYGGFGNWTQIYEHYRELIGEARDSAVRKFQAKESDIMVFSDNIIENDKSRMEVGPVYRYRLAAQKL